MFKYSFFFFIVFVISNSSMAQEKDSVQKKGTNSNNILGFFPKGLFKDTSRLQSPRKAVFRSAILPGWGQVRNRKWWKVPLVPAGFIGLGLVYNFNNNFYKVFLKESQFRLRNPGKTENTDYTNVSDGQITSAKNFYRRNRDLTIISTVGFYGLVMIDAYIDARLATFDVSDDLSFKVQPSIYVPSYVGNAGSPAPMIKLSINFK